MVRSKGEKVYLADLVQYKRTFFSSFRWLSGSKYGFLITQNYYTFSDLIGAIRVMKNSKWPKEERSIFCGYDLSLIFEEESSRIRFDVGALELLMHYYILKRLKNLGVNIRKMIITFENMFPEKPVIAGMREFYPEAEVVGFQHSVLFPLLLSLYTSCNERSVLPVPDKIVCSGRSFMKILEAEGYPREVLFEGPALRFQHLLSAEPAPCCQSKNKKAVLIALPLGQDSALELLFKSKEALDSMARSFEIIVKPHPMMGSQELKDLFNKALIDMNRYKLSDLPMGQLLSKTDVMITIASGAVYDAIASRICVIRVRRETEINLDPLDWFADNFGFVAQGPADIRDLLIRIFDMEEQESSDMLDKGVSLIKDCFSRVTEETMSAFLSGKKVVS